MVRVSNLPYRGGGADEGTLWTHYWVNGVTTSEPWPFSGDDSAPDLNPAVSLDFITERQRPSQLSMLFDGMGYPNRNAPQRIVARHGNAAITNMTFFDGHAAPIDRATMPSLYSTSGDPYFKIF